MRLIAAVLVLIALFATPAAAGKRVALVIGNGAYTSVPALANPRADAEEMAAALRRLGFEVELGVDLDLQGMRRTVQAFARRLQGAEVALFFYAGHGMQVYGQNYLLPVDAVLKSAADLDFATFPARLVLAQMERWPSVKIVILDACRDNPFATQLSRSMGSTRAARALSRGLAPIETAGGTLVAYATDPGDVAADGEGRHSPFTAALLEHIGTPGVEVNTMLARVRAEVYRSTDEQQRPWTETSLIGEFYMAPKAPEPPPVTEAMMAPRPAPAPGFTPQNALDPRTIELALWEAAEAGGTLADYQEYLRQYPEGIFAGIAQNRIAGLRMAEADGPGGGSATEDGAADESAAGAPADAPDGMAGTSIASTANAAEPAPAARDEARGDAPEDGSAARDTTAGATGPDEAGEVDEEPGFEIAALPGAVERTGTGVGGLAEDPQAAAAEGEAALGLRPGKRREVQARLMLAGHDPGAIDGIFGPGTREALSSWQAAEGLEQTGYLDATALARLERSTESEYAAWADRQRREAEARRAAAERARAAGHEPEAMTVRAAPVGSAPSVFAEPAPPPIAPPPQVGQWPTPTAEAAEEPRSHRERWEQDCYFVFAGRPQLERRCE
ncbi:MAG TPA: caspase family protein [Paracoccaceae bacterium]|nr:caspase family protein [Paracoccaceae bacterium]